ncbi:hypothetical protein DEW08_13100 [Azospirillum thermophilum]|uniref:Energy transducer TonB n=1 Tax=Azospirillum thermophilum TaxID=2202148 RepID=A0A2S2CUB6_9PROT|nr:hypothetical protein DEW08_13100 [Azospirillum thermophilum]
MPPVVLVRLCLPLLLALTAAVPAALPAAAQPAPAAQAPQVSSSPQALPPGYVEELENPPEDPLPPAPQDVPPAPAEPVVLAPDAVEILKDCKLPTFTDCFRTWRPPPPPPEPEAPPETKEAKTAPPPPPPGPPDPTAPREPAKGGPPPAPPPAPQPEADRATYDALARALKESGLDGKVLLGDPPSDGSATLRLDSKSAKPGQKPK